MTPRRPTLVLGFKPTSVGCAWVAFENPFSIFDWELADARGDANARCLTILERALRRLEPELMVIEDFESPKARHSPRIRRLCRAAVALARDRGVDVACLTRADVQAGFAPVGAKGRHEIASAIARSFDILRPILPTKRRIWETQPRRMAVFDAAALVLAHYQLSASQLFDDLSRGSADERDAA